MFGTFNFRSIARIISILLIVVNGFILFQPDAYAWGIKNEERLSKIDLVRFGHKHAPKKYSSDLKTLSKRCSTSQDRIAAMLERETNYIFKNGFSSDNLYILRSAVEASEGIKKVSDVGMTCKDLFPH
jgi:hypothetical protein